MQGTSPHSLFDQITHKTRRFFGMQPDYLKDKQNSLDCNIRCIESYLNMNNGEKLSHNA